MKIGSVCDFPVIVRNLAKITEGAGGGNPTQKLDEYVSGKILPELQEIAVERTKPRAGMPGLKDLLWGCDPTNLGNGNYFISESTGTGHYSINEVIAGSKRAGISRVIDIIHGDILDFAKDGIEFSHIHMDSMSSQRGFLMSPPFIDSHWFLEREVLGMPLSKANKFRKAHRAEFDAEYQTLTRDYVDRFVKFIQNMQKGNCLIRGYHEMEFKSMLLLNRMFNPMAEKTANEIAPMYMQRYEVEAFKHLYENLTEVDKQRLGWNEKFETRFHKIIADNEKYNDKIDKEFIDKYLTPRLNQGCKPNNK